MWDPGEAVDRGSAPPGRRRQSRELSQDGFLDRGGLPDAAEGLARAGKKEEKVKNWKHKLDLTSSFPLPSYYTVLL